eukprot:Gb_30399 [translate_table: standard]
MLASRASLLSQPLSIPSDGHGFNSSRSIPISSARLNSKAFTGMIWAKNDRIQCTKRVIPQATTSETNIVTSSEDEGSKTADTKKADEPPQEYEEYEVELEKPIGLKFYKGADRGTYIDAIAPGGNADKSKMFQVGDKVIATRQNYILYNKEGVTEASSIALSVIS